MTKVIINEKSTLDAEGTLHTKACKPVVCITTGKVYTSATDAAKANNTTIHSISCNCLGKTKTAAGKQFCYLKDVNQHLGHLVALIEKAAAYDAIKAEENAAIEAREKYEADLAKAKATYERRQAIYLRATEKMIFAQERFVEAEEALRALEEMGKQFEI